MDMMEWLIDWDNGEVSEESLASPKNAPVSFNSRQAVERRSFDAQ